MSELALVPSSPLSEPGSQPVSSPTAAARTANLAEKQIWEQLREASKTKSSSSRPGGCGSFFCRLLGCLTPDVVEHAAVFSGKQLLKATVDTLNLLQNVAMLDASDYVGAMRSVFGAGQDSEEAWRAFQFNKDKSNSPGFLTSQEMIYCCRLSLVSYLADVGYDSFFPSHRESELLSHVFNLDGSNEVHQIFLVNYVSSLFVQDRTNTSEFGRAKPLGDNLAPMNLELVHKFDVNHNQGFVAKSRCLAEEGGDIVIAFQGTVDREDVTTSMHGTSTPFEPLWDETSAGKYACLEGRALCCCLTSKGSAVQRELVGGDFGRVHVGFYNAFLCVKPIIERELARLVLDGKLGREAKPVRIVVTGHSLGGALACLCTAWLLQWFRCRYPGGALPDSFRVLSVTFGQPKVGDASFCQAVDKHEWTNRRQDSTATPVVSQQARFKLYRVFAPLDPVVTVPPQSMGFHHCYSMCALRAGSLFFLPDSLRTFNDKTNQGIKNAIDHGMSILQFHDLFCYLSNVMHFADNTRILDGDGDLDDVFGVVDYEADVRAAGFLERF